MLTFVNDMVLILGVILILWKFSEINNNGDKKYMNKQ